jgi:hypothetical protein
MSFMRVARRSGTCLLGVAALMAVTAAPAAAQDPPDDDKKIYTVTGGLDFVSTYMFRGIRQNSDGIAIWPYVDLGLGAYSGDGSLKSVAVNVGMWNSAHTDPGSWYEADYYATVGFGLPGGTALGVTYTSYTSPDDLFTHVKELAFKFTVDDSGAFGRGSMKPYALFAFEMGTDEHTGQADAGLGAGKYLELGIAPGYSATKASLAIPVKLGLSMGDYYEHPETGEDSTFGYFSIGAIVTVPIGAHFNIHGGGEFQALGDTTEYFNGGESTKGIGSIGLGFSF